MAHARVRPRSGVLPQSCRTCRPSHIELFDIGQRQPVVSCKRPRAMPGKGAPNCVSTPVAVGRPVWVVGHGSGVLCGVKRDNDGLEGWAVLRELSELIKGAEAFGLRATDGGLRPPPPSSVEPSGIPTMPTDDPGPIDEAIGGNAVADAAQVPGAAAIIPPPSKSALPMPAEPPAGRTSHGVRRYRHRTSHGSRRRRRRSADACRADHGRRAGCDRAHAWRCEFGSSHGNSSLPNRRIWNAKGRRHAKRRKG